MDANETATRAWELRLNMMRVALSILRNGADAEDAISEAILKACRSAGRLRTEEQFKPWLISILVRCCYDILRKRKHELLAEDVASYREQVLENEQGSVFELLQELSPNYRNVLILHYYEGFKAKEIARVLSMPLGTVLVSLSRGRNKLRALLEKEDFAYAEKSI